MKKYVFIYVIVLSLLLSSCAKPKDAKSAENLSSKTMSVEETVSEVLSAERHTETISTSQTISVPPLIIQLKPTVAALSR